MTVVTFLLPTLLAAALTLMAFASPDLDLSTRGPHRKIHLARVKTRGHATDHGRAREQHPDEPRTSR